MKTAAGTAIIVSVLASTLQAAGFKGVPVKVSLGAVPRLAMTIGIAPALHALSTLDAAALPAFPELALPREAAPPASLAHAPEAPGIVRAEPERRPRRANPVFASLEAVEETTRTVAERPRAAAAVSLSFAFDEARLLRP